MWVSGIVEHCMTYWGHCPQREEGAGQSTWYFLSCDVPIMSRLTLLEDMHPIICTLECSLPVDALLDRECESDRKQEWLSVHRERLRQARDRAREHSERKAAKRVYTSVLSSTWVGSADFLEVQTFGQEYNLGTHWVPRFTGRRTRCWTFKRCAGQQSSQLRVATVFKWGSQASHKNHKLSQHTGCIGWLGRDSWSCFFMLAEKVLQPNQRTEEANSLELPLVTNRERGIVGRCGHRRGWNASW